jgi:nicotinate-nucleotide adenylyltransferase
MDFFYRACGRPSRLAVFPGTFNPMTVAHRALARAALAQADEVVLVLPRVLPHKDYSGATFESRAEMLCAAVGGNEPISVAASEKGLFVEIAAECREAYGPAVSLAFLCGRDAAERIADWDYGYPGAFPEMLRQFHLLVAARQGEYEPPEELRAAVRRLTVPREHDEVSASEVRRRIANGEAWEHLVPPELHAQVRKIYR